MSAFNNAGRLEREKKREETIQKGSASSLVHQGRYSQRGRKSIPPCRDQALNHCKFTLTVLTPADESHHIDKHKFTVPFVCGARDLGEALRRIAEGAAMIRTKGQAGTGENSSRW